MAETTKLSVGEALNKLRDADPPASKMARLDEKIGELDQETRRLRETRLSLERSQRVGAAGPDVQEANQGANQGRATKLNISGIMIGIVIGSLILALTCWLLWL
jgi:hypothetical protein